MAKSAAAMVTVGDREVRVSSPDRVVYEATERTPQITKLEVCEYVAAVGDVMMRSIGERPTAMERWPDGWRDGMRLATGPQDREGDGFYQKRLPRGAPDFVETVRIQFPGGRFADELCPTEPASLVWAAQMGTLTFHPWPVRRADVDHPDELRIDLDPQPGRDFADAVEAAFALKELMESLGFTPFVKTSGNRGVHVYARIAPTREFLDVRHGVIGIARELERRLPDLVTTEWWKELRGEKVFVDFNQANRDRTIAAAYSPRPLTGAPVSMPVAWSELRDVKPSDFTVRTVPGIVADRGDAWEPADGASMIGTCPVLPLPPEHALAVGLTSYDGTITYGLHADRDAVPDLDVLAQAVHDAIDELEHATRGSRRR